jgi:hypothetical protein
VENDFVAGRFAPHHRFMVSRLRADDYAGSLKLINSLAILAPAQILRATGVFGIDGHQPRHRRCPHRQGLNALIAEGKIAIFGVPCAVGIAAVSKADVFLTDTERSQLRKFRQKI